MKTFVEKVFHALSCRIEETVFLLTRWFSWPFRLFCKRFCLSSRKNILFKCDSLVMSEHLRDFWELFQDDSHLRFHVWFPTRTKKQESISDMKKILPVSEVGPLSVYSRNWNLIALPNHSPLFLTAMRKTPAVFIGHGYRTSKPGMNESGSYNHRAFDKNGRSLYVQMFETDNMTRDSAIEFYPALKDLIVVVGSIANDKLLAMRDRRDEFRRRFGFMPDDTVVFVLSTWRKECFFEIVGDAFLKEARKLMGEFKFVLTIHPNEYRSKPPGQRVWGDYLRSQRKHGFVVREPSEDWLPYMLACDIILTDHTSLQAYGILLEKPLICVPVPDDIIWRDSATWKVREFAPVLDDMRNLRKALLEAKTNYPMDRLKQLASEMNPYPGQSAERIRKEIYELLDLTPPKGNVSL